MGYVIIQEAGKDPEVLGDDVGQQQARASIFADLTQPGYTHNGRRRSQSEQDLIDKYGE